MLRCIQVDLTYIFIFNINVFSVSLLCGGTSAENVTYILGGDDFMSDEATCAYHVCKCDSSVCRVKLEFNVSYSFS